MGFGLGLTPRVQVPNNHILSKILTYITTILKPRVPNYWVLWTLGIRARVEGYEVSTLLFGFYGAFLLCKVETCFAV